MIDAETELWRQKAEVWRALAKAANDQHTAHSFSLLASEAEEVATEIKCRKLAAVTAIDAVTRHLASRGRQVE